MNYTTQQKKIIGENIWIRRQELGMSKEDLGKAYGCGIGAINYWERGDNVPPRGRMKDLAKILKCSVHELHRPHNIPTLSFSEPSILPDKKEEPMMSNADMIKAASEVFENGVMGTDINTNTTSNTESNTTDKQTDKQADKHPVVDRLNKYLKESGVSQNELARRLSISPATVNRVTKALLPYKNPNYVRIENYLNGLENSNEETVLNVKPEQYPNLVVAEQKQQNAEKDKPKTKSSISDRLNDIYNVLFNAMAELDELKCDINKIEKATAMLKEIQGL